MRELQSPRRKILLTKSARIVKGGDFNDVYCASTSQKFQQPVRVDFGGPHGGRRRETGKAANTRPTEIRGFVFAVFSVS
jgi:hypothetical protein